MYNISGVEFSTNQFSYDPETFEFYADASSLRDQHLKALLIHNVDYVGFILVSHKTNAKVPFFLHKIIRDNEGIPIFWEYRAVSLSLSNVKVLVFND